MLSTKPRSSLSDRLNVPSIDAIRPWIVSSALALEGCAYEGCAEATTGSMRPATASVIASTRAGLFKNRFIALVTSGACGPYLHDTTSKIPRTWEKGEQRATARVSQ